MNTPDLLDDLPGLGDDICTGVADDASHLHAEPPRTASNTTTQNHKPWSLRFNTIKTAHTSFIYIHLCLNMRKRVLAEQTNKSATLCA